MMWRITVFLLLWANLAFADFPQHVNNALAQTFNVNQLNQLGSVTRNTTFTLTGALPGPANSVTVNGSTAQVYGDFTFANTNNTTLANGNNTFTVVAENVYSTSVTNTLVVNLPSSNSFQYDNNGNLTNDGTRVFTYDSENRLDNVTVTGQYQTVYVYDGLSRLRKMTNFAWESGAWTSTNVTYYVYDGMTVLQERNASSTPEVTYTRGLDLSASLNGAGGIGGLLSRTDGNGTTFYHSDGNGNVTALTDSNANVVARCEYDPFGRMLALTGPMASVNHYWFSSKEYTPAGLYDFGGRFYEPNFQRWINRDPIQEAGGVNLYTFVDNSPLNAIDLFGLDAVFTFVNGSTQTASSVAQFQAAANSASPGSISSLTITGHTSLDKAGGADAQGLGRDDNQGSIFQNAFGKTVLADPASTAAQWTSLSNLLAGKLATNATINLKGCKNGNPSDPNNIAKSISKELPTVPVTGQNQNLRFIPWTDVTLPIPFLNTTTTYLNGAPQYPYIDNDVSGHFYPYPGAGPL
jgi:RHS repeat-associated protein